MQSLERDRDNGIKYDVLITVSIHSSENNLKHSHETCDHSIYLFITNAHKINNK